MGVIFLWLLSFVSGIVTLIMLALGLVFLIYKRVSVGFICIGIGLIAILIVVTLMLQANYYIVDYCPTHMADCG